MIQCVILIGNGTDETAICSWPRIPMMLSELPLQFKWLQFPIQLAFGMTINKAQGQILRAAGIIFTPQCFSNGQL